MPARPVTPPVVTPEIRFQQAVSKAAAQAPQALGGNKVGYTGVNPAAFLHPLSNIQPMHITKVVPQEKSDGGILPTVLSAVLSPGTSVEQPLVKATTGVGKFIAGDVKGFLNLPKSTLESGITLGKAWVHDITHGDLSGTLGPASMLIDPKSQVGQLSKAAFKSDPVVQAITHGSTKPLLKDPFGTTMDALAVFDAAGKLGAAGLRGAGKFSRADEARPVVPGYGASQLRPLGHNPLTWPIQRAIRGTEKAVKLTDEGMQAAKHEAQRQNIPLDQAQGYVLARNPQFARQGPVGSVVQRLQAARMTQQLHQSEATQHTIGRGQTAHDIRETAKQLDKVQPDAHAGVVPWATLVGPSKEGLTVALDHVRQAIHSDKYDNAPAAIQNAMKAHAEALQAAIADPHYNPEAVAEAVRTYGARQAPLEAQKHDLGILPMEKAKGRIHKMVALANIPGSLFIRKADKVVDPAWKAEHRAAKADVAEAQKAYQEALQEHTGTQQTHAAAIRTMSDILRRASNSNEFANDQLINHYLAMREAVRSNAQDVKPITAAEVKRTRGELQQAQTALNQVKASKRHIFGTVVPDETARPLGGKKYGGLQLRPLNPEQDLAHIYAGGIDPAYVRMTNPGAMPDIKTGPKMANLGAKGGENTANRVFTGESLGGTFQPDYGVLKRSQIGDIREIALQRQFKGMIDRTAAPQTFASPAEAQNFADGVKARTGIDGQIFDVGNGAYKVVPKPSWDEFQAQFKRDYPGSRAARIVLGANHGFRNTVLAFSPKLPVMHTVETTSRTLLNTSYNPLRAIADARIGKLALDRQSEGMKALLAPGGTAGHGARMREEDMGRIVDSTDRGKVRQFGRNMYNLYDRGTSGIIGMQRWLVKYGEYASLGKVGRQMAQEAGDSWLHANTSIKDLARKTAEGLNDPVQAERAARDMHYAYGQYQAYTARTRMAIRVAPFASWYVNAAKLVYLHLPKDHPYASVLLHDIAKMQQQQWDQQHKNLPADMQAAMPAGPNEWLDIGKFTPTGVDKNPFETGLSQIAPQVQGPLKALYGLDPFNQPISDKKYGSDKLYKGGLFGSDVLGTLARGAEQVAGEYGGPANLIARNVLYGKGGTLTNASTPVLKMLRDLGGVLGNKDHGPIKTEVRTPASKMKQGPLGGILGPSWDKAIDPFHPVHFGGKGRPKGSTSTSGGSSGGSSGGGGGGTLGLHFSSYDPFRGLTPGQEAGNVKVDIARALQYLIAHGLGIGHAPGLPPLTPAANGSGAWVYPGERFGPDQVPTVRPQQFNGGRSPGTWAPHREFIRPTKIPQSGPARLQAQREHGLGRLARPTKPPLKV